MSARWTSIKLRQFVDLTNTAESSVAAARKLLSERAESLAGTAGRGADAHSSNKLMTACIDLASACASTAPASRLGVTAGAVQGAALAVLDGHRSHLQSLRTRGAGAAPTSTMHELEDWLDNVLWCASSIDLIARHAVAVTSPSPSDQASGHPGGPAPGGPATLPVRPLDLVGQVLNDTAEIKAFCVEKFGVAPPVVVETVHGDGHSRPTRPADGHDSASGSGSQAGPSPDQGQSQVMLKAAVPEHVRYMYTELLKNALRSHIDRYGAAGVDDAPPVSVTIGAASRGSHASVKVTDHGPGLKLRDGSGLLRPVYGPVTTFPYFSSDASQRAEPNYQYSREFGVPFTGHGTGLARARLYALMHGGGLVLNHAPGVGVDAMLWLDASGWSATDDPAVLARQARSEAYRGVRLQ